MALSGIMGALAGVAAGFLAGEFLGRVDTDRVRRAVHGFRSLDDDVDPAELQREVTEVLDANPTTRRMGVRAIAVGNGVVELTGTAQDESERELAASLVRNNTSAPVVVNRVLVEGVEVKTGKEALRVQR